MRNRKSLLLQKGRGNKRKKRKSLRRLPLSFSFFLCARDWIPCLLRHAGREQASQLWRNITLNEEEKEKEFATTKEKMKK
jgi:hypothetical protein